MFISSSQIVLHSLVEVLALGTVIAVFVTRFLYLPIISGLFGVDCVVSLISDHPDQELDSLFSVPFTL